MTSQCSRIRAVIEGFGGCATATQIIDALNDQAINKKVLAKRLATMKERGEVLFTATGEFTAYELAGDYQPLRYRELPAPREAARSASVELPAVPMARKAADELSSIEDLANQAAAKFDVLRDRFADPLGLLARAEAVATDIEDLVGDACDGRVDHDLIKALHVAYGAINRFARRLAQG